MAAAQYAAVAQMEANIDEWMNGPTGYRACILAARTTAAQLLGTPFNDTVLVDNASEAINDILRNFEPPLGPDEVILDLSTAYGPFHSLYLWLGERQGVQVLQVPISWPVTSADSFLDPVRAVLAANASTLNIRVAVISHISAYPSVVLPVADLTTLFHSYGIPVIVDGAHALGNIAINVPSLGNPEYYLTNFHKHYSSSKSSAALYVRADRQQLYVPAPSVIDNLEIQDFPDRFIWTGTRDRTAWCAIQAATSFRESLGGEDAVLGYMQSLVQSAESYLVGLWGVPRMAPNATFLSSMANVKLPTDNSTQCGIIRSQLLSTYNMSVSGWTAVEGFPCYFRLSAQVYLDMTDFERLGDAVLSILKQLRNAM